MLKEQREVAIVLFGFRIGQLLEIYKDARVWPPAVAVLIPDLQANLELAVRECGFGPDVASTIYGMVDQQHASFGDAARLIEWAGPSWLFDQLQDSCSRLETTIRSVSSKRECVCLKVGVLLGKSFGDPPGFFESPVRLLPKPTGDPSWEYRSLDDLQSALASLELGIEEISGLPLDISAFVARLDPHDEQFRRYPANHWGWVIIEERLLALQPDPPSHRNRPVARDLEQGAAIEVPSELVNRANATAGETNVDHADIVETSQIAALVRKSSKTVQRWLGEAPLILPHSEGGGGRATLWRWSMVRERIAKKSRRDMPEQFPGNI